MILVVGGPNSRKDYHVDPVEEFFYQVEGDMVLKIMENDNRVDIPIKEGEIFLLPKYIPHSPQRFKDTIGLVIEFKRDKGKVDPKRLDNAYYHVCPDCDPKRFAQKKGVEKRKTLDSTIDTLVTIDTL